MYSFYFKSESGDTYTVSSKELPVTESEWLDFIKEKLPGEYQAYLDAPYGPGIANTWLHLIETYKMYVR